MKQSTNQLKWYGYLHTNGTVHIKRYFNDYGDIIEAKSSPFVQHVIEPFEAQDRDSAKNEIIRQLTTFQK